MVRKISLTVRGEMIPERRHAICELDVRHSRTASAFPCCASTGNGRSTGRARSPMACRRRGDIIAAAGRQGADARNCRRSGHRRRRLDHPRSRHHPQAGTNAGRLGDRQLRPHLGSGQSGDRRWRRVHLKRAQESHLTIMALAWRSMDHLVPPHAEGGSRERRNLTARDIGLGGSGIAGRMRKHANRPVRSIRRRCRCRRLPARRLTWWQAPEVKPIWSRSRLPGLWARSVTSTSPSVPCIADSGCRTSAAACASPPDLILPADSKIAFRWDVAA